MSDLPVARTRAVSWLTIALAAGSGLAGALVGAGVSYLSTQQQIDANNDQAEVVFLRDQRKADYSGFLGSVAETEQCINDAWAQIDTQKERGQLNAALVNPTLGRCQGLGNSTYRLLGGIDLVSSEDVSKASLAVADDLRSSFEAVAAYVQGVYDEDPMLNALRKNLEAEFGQVESDRTELEARMRVALSG